MKSTKGIIAAGNPVTANAAKWVMEAGGNAYDAAVAALFAAFIGEPCMCSPGGGGFLTALTSERKAFTLDFFVQTPKHKPLPSELDFVPITVDFGTATEVFYVGKGSSGVPGVIAGIFEMHAQFCKLPLKDLAAPAIQMARDGVRVDDFQAWDFHLLADILRLDPKSRAIFLPEGKTLAEGSTIRIPELADFLEALVAEGRDLFYRGEISALASQPDQGGSLHRSDFEQYQAIYRNPLRFNYRNHQVITNPPPSIGGGLIAFGLERLFPLEKPTYRPQSQGHLECLVAALKAMDLLHQNETALRAELARLAGGGFRFAGNALGGTTHFSILDEYGNAVALSVSNGEGNGQMIPGAGFMMNNMLGETALLPNGLHSWLPNARLSSMMAPTVVADENGHPLLALGTGGAGRIAGAILQVLHHTLDLGLSPEDAVTAPRMHWRKDVLNLESGWPTKKITGNPHEIVQWDSDMFFGGVHTAGIFKGAFHGAGDPRRSGVVEVMQ